MAGEIAFAAASGQTAYVVIRNSASQPWNTATPAFEAYTPANYPNYKVAAAEQGASGYYTANFPATIPRGQYDIVARTQVGGAAAEGDPALGTGEVWWDGTQPVSPASLVLDSTGHVSLGTADEVSLARLDATVSSRLAATADPTAALTEIAADTDTTLTNVAAIRTDYTTARAVKLDDLDAAVSSRLAATADPTAALATLQTSATEIAGDTDTTLANIATLQTAVTDVQTDVDELQGSVAALPSAGSITTLQTAVTDVQGDVDAVETTLNAMRVDYTTARAVKLDDLDAAVSSRLAATADPTAALATMQTALTDVQTDVDELQVSVAAIPSISGYALQATLTDVQTDVDEVQTALTTLQTALTDVQTDVDELQVSVAGIAPVSGTISITAVTQVIDLTTGIGTLTNQPLQVDLTAVRATDWGIHFLITRTDGTAQDTTGWKAIFEVRDDLDDTINPPIISKTTSAGGGITNSLPLLGDILVSIDDTDTAEDEPYTRFPLGIDRWYTITYFLPTGDKQPGAWGRFNVVPWGTKTDVPPA